MNVLNKLLALFVLSLSLNSVTAVAQDSELNDPWEGFNRGVFNFNESLDRAILKPVAQGYRFIMPDVAEQGVSNFFDNLRDVVTFFNNVLQLKPVEATQDLSRVLINTTIGIGGLFDVASAMDIPKNDEDFGQTLGAWGVESGPYLVLPLFGPSTVRDGVGIIPDMYLDPLNQVESDELRYGLKALKVVDKRASLLDREGVVTGDRYTFIRDAYLQKREFEVNDGRVEYNADDF
ncbi:MULTISPECIES: VacJ family lipoprotein [unclassified Marinobacterium]|jgi:phospholipid-binding lipoprotein MlaA|uniref:MlaA family lipoprotein n=1 Tax=unclassified Marinobacterium TaxID=2644139 RepID=UPI00156A6AA4|nr:MULTISPECIES: VacJ family lipoprotein [unclassified Marinobacterium]NRP09563.1 putative phospholipid-binding lipoprotein MlaA precursor [Marinobacterium sp. xm-g-48]NRP16527.1 putative phospholipid-binding lipoprotein MlaA precursor [Marinobacterium sp. xm-a-152]NRP28480.1 putative phospholipid-binding lipoprotein MlaA precursor [Marinobacterium sp. xm-d-420]NRP35352.1 putative phospholipid-binding lipoprotein MlaA precursor [Marinobacterium sp. xm-d-579]NRP37910.1 putative phospholipid-bin